MESLATGSGLIRVNGYRLYHETYGTPEKGTLLVLHGGPGISHDYLHPLADSPIIRGAYLTGISR